jgi:hypothetical protein
MQGVQLKLDSNYSKQKRAPGQHAFVKNILLQPTF